MSHPFITGKNRYICQYFVSEYERDETHTFMSLGCHKQTHTERVRVWCEQLAQLSQRFSIQFEPDVMHTILDKIPGKLKEIKSVTCLIKQTKKNVKCSPVRILI